MKPWLSAEASTVAAKLRAGQALRMQVVDRPHSRCQLRLGFSATDLVAPPAVEALLRRGIAVLTADGAIRHAEGGGTAGARAIEEQPNDTPSERDVPCRSRRTA